MDCVVSVLLNYHVDVYWLYGRNISPVKRGKNETEKENCKHIARETFNKLLNGKENFTIRKLILVYSWMKSLLSTSFLPG